MEWASACRRWPAVRSQNGVHYGYYPHNCSSVWPVTPGGADRRKKRASNSLIRFRRWDHGKALQGRSKEEGTERGGCRGGVGVGVEFGKRFDVVSAKTGPGTELQEVELAFVFFLPSFSAGLFPSCSSPIIITIMRHQPLWAIFIQTTHDTTSTASMLCSAGLGWAELSRTGEASVRSD